MKFQALRGKKWECLLGVANEWVTVNPIYFLYLWITGVRVKITK